MKEEYLPFKHYHHKDKDCKIEKKNLKRYTKSGKFTFIHGIRCITHQVDACDCGWEFGHHFDWETSEKEKIYACTNCGTMFKRLKSSMKNVKNPFCSAECRIKGGKNETI